MNSGNLRDAKLKLDSLLGSMFCFMNKRAEDAEVWQMGQERSGMAWA
tara:strand:- start:1270 stop:1410 length:141 start_codon:yes stop_codon:yes gene_type:complete